MSRAVIVDVETTGLDPAVDHVWEIAVISVYAGHVDRWSMLVDHDAGLAGRLPVRYFDQHNEACAAGPVMPVDVVRSMIHASFVPDEHGSVPTLVGACPWFDAAFLRKLVGGELWHHRLRCVESMTAGHLGRDVGGLSDCLAALDLAPIREAHRAAGDADAALRIWQHLTHQENS
ncbi:hypothetical protein [Gordonia sp. (in: high G+C Gram-positive bacteria)]|uniref:3'-5' exonuclease n=1 Tax=Gordonia sp. (in: high G+C Gram-positive bacteria) TaxID=84139 RepID=UPI00333F6C36